MDDHRFDHLTRAFSTATPRRALAGALVGGTFAALFGWNAEETAAKRRRRKKKKPSSGCTPNCAGKGCGDADGCGGRCTTQQGCGASETCSNGQCVADPTCADITCRGNHVCKNGDCVCPDGLKECDLYNCGECCPDAFHGEGDRDCDGNPNGEWCYTTEDNPVLHCTCLPGQVLCNDGQCGQCCGDAFCLAVGGQSRYCNANKFCACPQGLTHCSNELGCVDTDTNRNACGPSCIDCGSGWECEGGSCCIPLAGDCALYGSSACCDDLQCLNIGTYYDPNYVCG